MVGRLTCARAEPGGGLVVVRRRIMSRVATALGACPADNNSCIAFSCGCGPRCPAAMQPRSSVLRGSGCASARDARANARAVSPNRNAAATAAAVAAAPIAGNRLQATYPLPAHDVSATLFLAMESKVTHSEWAWWVTDGTRYCIRAVMYAPTEHHARCGARTQPLGHARVVVGERRAGDAVGARQGVVQLQRRARRRQQRRQHGGQYRPAVAAPRVPPLQQKGGGGLSMRHVRRGRRRRRRHQRGVRGRSQAVVAGSLPCGAQTVP